MHLRIGNDIVLRRDGCLLSSFSLQIPSGLVTTVHFIRNYFIIKGFINQCLSDDIISISTSNVLSGQKCLKLPNVGMRFATATGLVSTVRNFPCSVSSYDRVSTTLLEWKYLLINNIEVI